MSTLVLRPYQETLIADTKNALSEHKSVVIQLDTAGGKSVVLSEILRLGRDKQFVVAHRKELLKQVKEHLSNWMPAEKIAIVAGGVPFNTEASMFLISIASFSGISHLLPYPSLIAVDECHHATAATYLTLLDQYPKAKILGLTATPQRLDGTPLNEVFNVLVCGPSTSQLHQQGYVAKYDYYAPAWRMKDKGCRVKNEFSSAKIGTINKSTTVATEILKAYKNLLNGKRTLVFAQTVEHSKEIASEFFRHGLRCQHMDGETPEDMRESGMSALKIGKLDVITSVNLFDEGIDIPDLEGVLIARRTASLTKYLQMCGRIKRLSDKVLTKRIVDCTDNWQEHGLPSFDRDWSINGAGKEPESPAMSRNTKTGEIKQARDHLPSQEIEVVYRQVWSANTIDYSLVEKLYEQGLTDKKIAKKCNCSQASINQWRLRNGLKSNHKLIDKLAVEDLYNQGLTDIQIGKRLQCSTVSINKWRIKNNLPSNSSAQVDYSCIKKSYDQGLLDKEIAQQCNCSLVVIGVWRKERGLPSNRISDTSMFQLLYDQEFDDKQIAAECQCPESRVKTWRREKKLPSHNKPPDLSSLPALYKQGLNDKQIAEILGCNSETVGRHREKMGLLPVKIKNSNSLQKQFQKLYDKGLFDEEIALKCGCGPTCVHNWRKKNNLIANGKKTKSPHAN